MTDLADHYRQLLGLDGNWDLDEVELSLDEQSVHIRLSAAAGASWCCPDCGRACPLKDHGPERSWRHLDTMQFQTRLTARLPRTACPDCGVKTVAPSWARPHGRFTLMFEAFAIRVLQAAASVKQACVLLGLDWKSAQGIMDRAVQRGLGRRDLTELKRVGLDEKSFGRSTKYVTLMTDVDERRVIDLVPGHDHAATDGLWRGLGESVCSRIDAVAMDMWKAFENSTARHAPQALIVHDRFHISKLLNDAVDAVRRQEHKALMRQGDDALKGSRYLWLTTPEDLDEQRSDRFERAKAASVKTARAWSIREALVDFWGYRYPANARKYFMKWWAWACRCRLKPVVKAARAIRKRLDNVLNYFKHRISNGPAEGFNSRIQALKSAARGFRNFNNYRTRVLFFCGKLKLMPDGISH